MDDERKSEEDWSQMQEQGGERENNEKEKTLIEKEAKVFIDHDTTWRERRNNPILREMARTLKEDR